MTPGPDIETIIAEAVSVLPEIAAALDPKEQPAGGSWVALTVHSPRDEANGESTALHRAYFTWRYDAPLEPLEESRYLELTRDEKTGVIKVPVWAFELTPLGDREWQVGYWFGAPLRMWAGRPRRRPNDGVRAELRRASEGRRLGPRGCRRGANRAAARLPVPGRASIRCDHRAALRGRPLPVGPAPIGGSGGRSRSSRPASSRSRARRRPCRRGGRSG